MVTVVTLFQEREGEAMEFRLERTCCWVLIPLAAACSILFRVIRSLDLLRLGSGSGIRDQESGIKDKG